LVSSLSFGNRWDGPDESGRMLVARARAFTTGK
jgi:hypothetical protein